MTSHHTTTTGRTKGHDAGSTRARWAAIGAGTKRHGAGSIRTRWAAIGAAVAVTLGAGGISLAQASIGSGAKSVFVAITPCRLVDTRPGVPNVGARTTPLGAKATLTLQVTGSTGRCSGIPAGATAAAMNVTAIQGSTRSFLTVYPADASLPKASNLNWNGGDPPTPNKVDVKLSSTGAVKMTNDAGTVHVAADLVGYYVDHIHDDRYYTEQEVDALVGGVATEVVTHVEGTPIDWVPDATAIFSEPIVTTTDGRWLVSIWSASTISCSGGDSNVFFYIVVDGDPIESSMRRKSTALGEQLIGATESVIPSGEHDVRLGMECATGSSLSSIAGAPPRAVNVVVLP